MSSSKPPLMSSPFTIVLPFLRPLFPFPQVSEAIGISRKLNY